LAEGAGRMDACVDHTTSGLQCVSRTGTMPLHKRVQDWVQLSDEKPQMHRSVCLWW